MVQKDLTALKLLKLHFVFAEHDSVSLWYVECAMFYHKKGWIMNYYHEMHPWSQNNWHVLDFLFWNFWHFPPQQRQGSSFFSCMPQNCFSYLGFPRPQLLAGQFKVNFYSCFLGPNVNFYAWNDAQASKKGFFYDPKS